LRTTARSSTTGTVTRSAALLLVTLAPPPRAPGLAKLPDSGGCSAAVQQKIYHRTAALKANEYISLV
jgi:hypothetical protein